MARRRPPRVVPRPKRTKIVDETVELTTGHERHLQFHLRKDDTITATCKARTKFYADFLTRPEYTKRVNGAGPGMFNFDFGTDDTGFTTKARIEDDDDYYLVLRNGVFSPRVHIAVQVSVERVGPVEPTIRSG